MTKNTAKNISPRSSITIELIKEALLRLLRKKNYMEISITDICNEAGVSRGSFYAHFDHIRDVVDLLFDDALQHIGNIPLQELCRPSDKSNDGLPLCMFIRQNRKYQPLFFSDRLYIYAVERTVESLREGFLSFMRTQTALNDDQIEDLLYYQIMGCMYICKKHIDMPDEDWKKVKCHVDQFLKNGFCQYIE